MIIPVNTSDISEAKENGLEHPPRVCHYARPKGVKKKTRHRGGSHFKTSVELIDRESSLAK